MPGYADNMSENVANALLIAASETKDFGGKEIGNLTLFLGILGDAKSAAAGELHSLGVTYDTVKPLATKFFRHSEESGAIGKFKQALRDIQAKVSGVRLSKSATYTFDFANKQAQSRGSKILIEDILLVMLKQKDPELVILLGKMRVNVSWLHDKVLQLLEERTEGSL